MKDFFIFVILLASFFACVEYQDQEWTDDSTPDDCRAACANLARLQCPGWEGSPGADETFGTEDDKSCEEVCREVMDLGETTLYPKCTAKAESCEAVEACFVD